MSPRAAWRLESLGFSNVYDYVAGEADWLAFGLPTEGKRSDAPRAGHVARRNASTCGMDEPLGAVRDRMEATSAERCIVINEASVVLGRVLAGRLSGNDDQQISSVMEAGPTTVRPSEPLEPLLDRMREHDVQTMLVTRSDGTLFGLLHRQDAESFLAKREAGR